MSLSSAKAKLDAQGGDPVTGYISKTDHQESYDELVDDTALTGATTAEALDVAGALTGATVASDATVAGTGLAGGLLSSANPVMDSSAAPGTSAVPSRQDHVHPSDTTKVTGPASATDNALVRFDGTGGKTVQNSGITVDDSDNISGIGTIGSGAVTSSGAVQAAAASGFVVGSSGPRIMSGTNSPEGVVTAPVGSRRIRTDGNTLGAFEYQKRSGTGSTGWVVADGDTGWRNVSAEIFPAHLALNPNAKVLIRRVGKQVTVTYASGASPTATGLQQLTDSDTIPIGFQHTSYATGVNPTGITIDAGTGFGTSVSLYMSSPSILRSGNQVSGTGYNGSVTYPTNDAWPSSLPGSAA